MKRRTCYKPQNPENLNKGKLQGRKIFGARLRGRTATQRSKKGSGKGSGEGVLRRVPRRGPAMGFTVKTGSEKGFSEEGSEKAISRRCLERPLEQHAPLGVRPKNSININLVGPDFLWTFLTLAPECPGVKKFLHTTGAAGKRTLWRGRPRFSARTSMTRRVVEKLCTKKFALIFWPLKVGLRPVLFFVGVFVSLVFFCPGHFLGVFSVFCLFYRGFQGFAR